MANSVIWICKTENGKEFKVVPKASAKNEKSILQMERNILVNCLK